VIHVKTSKYFLLGLLLIFTSFGCSLMPPERPHDLGLTLKLRDTLTEKCNLSFTSSLIDNDITLHIGHEEAGIYTVKLIGSDDSLMQVVFEVTPETETLIWRDNHIDTCLVQLLSQIGQGWIHDWYYEKRGLGVATQQNSEISAKLFGGGNANLALEITALAFTDKVNTLTTSASQRTNGSTVCGKRIVSGLDSQRLNMRAEPGINAPIITKITEGTKITHLCTTEQVEGHLWTKIEVMVEGIPMQGWVSDEYLR